MHPLKTAIANQLAHSARLRKLRKQHSEAEALLRKHDYKFYLVREHPQGDRARKLLAWLVHDEHQNPPIGTIKIHNSTLAVTQSAINDAFQDYYHTLYGVPPAPTHMQLEAFMTEAPVSRLSPAQTAALEEPIRIEELHAAIA
ncbi:hypothetical protein NDU88_002433 [Pleurodeles waltl]|uniref:Uncharacterized protein n=1 Tax=Pleurodeles waltl TaxID=8319 RepID=A0AAV7U9P6_PLEWA|nr:hypothetical protein NDU88_002433 [Pleurodeles waltl]